MTDPTTLETLRGWVATGGILLNAIVGLRVVPSVLQYLRESRAQKLEERKSDRAGWGELISALQEDIVRVRADHADCERRQHAMQGEIDGLRRMIVAQSAVQAVGMASPVIQDAADRTAAAVLKSIDKDR